MPTSLSSIPGTHIEVEGRNQLHKVVLQPPHMCHGTRGSAPSPQHQYTYSHKDTSKDNKISKKLKIYIASTKYPEVNSHIK